MLRVNSSPCFNSVAAASGSATETGLPLESFQPFVFLNVTLVSPVQPEKIEPSILVTESGIVMLVSPVQPEKAPQPILVTESGIVMLVSPVQPEKASEPILVTESGIVMLVRPVQPEKAYQPMLVTELGITIFSRFLHSPKFAIEVSPVVADKSRRTRIEGEVWYKVFKAALILLIVVESKFPVALRVLLAGSVSIVFTMFSGVTSIVMLSIVVLSCGVKAPLQPVMAAAINASAIKSMTSLFKCFIIHPGI